MAYRQVHLEFEFVDDPSGNPDGGTLTVSAGNLESVIANSLAAGEVQDACRLYEDHGAAIGDQLVASFLSASSSTRDHAARMFELARDFARAARLTEASRRWKDAAGLHERAGDFLAAGRCHQQAGEGLAAAKAFDRAGRVDLALPLYEREGAQEAVADCLARNGRPLQAAEIYRQLGNAAGEAEALRLLPVLDPSFPAATRRLAGLYLGAGRLAEATRTLIEAMRQSPEARGDRELCTALLGLLERQELTAQAERIRAHLARLTGGAPPPAPAPAPAAAAAPAPSAAADGYASLKAIPIFAELALADMRDLYRAAEEVRFPAGAVIAERGAPAPGLFVILEGQVEVSVGAGAEARTLNRLGPGQHFGEISLVQRGTTSARVAAGTPVRALAISGARFDHFVYTHEAASARIYRLFSATLAERVRVLSAELGRG